MSDRQARRVTNECWLACCSRVASHLSRERLRRSIIDHNLAVVRSSVQRWPFWQVDAGPTGRCVGFDRCRSREDHEWITMQYRAYRPDFSSLRQTVSMFTSNIVLIVLKTRNLHNFVLTFSWPFLILSISLSIIKNKNNPHTTTQDIKRYPPVRWLLLVYILCNKHWPMAALIRIWSALNLSFTLEFAWWYTATDFAQAGLPGTLPDTVVGLWNTIYGRQADRQAGRQAGP